MSQDDPFAPFGDDDKTVVRRPSPGGRVRPPLIGEPPYAPPPPQAPPPQLAELGLEGGRRALFGENPVVAAALSLLSLVTRLGNTVSHRDIAGLQKQLVAEFRAFENKLLQLGITQEQTPSKRT